MAWTRIVLSCFVFAGNKQEVMTPHKPAQLHRSVDRIGMLASGACAVHCLLVPLLLAISPVLGEVLHEAEWLERGFVWVAVVVSALSIGFGVLRHGQFVPALLLWSLGAALLLPVGLGYEPASEWLHAAQMVPGGIAIALAHLANWRALKRCEGHAH